MGNLKPCPFCGTKSAVLNEYTPMSGHSYYYIECRNKKCNINPVTHNFGTEEEAIKAWNTRYERTCHMIDNGVELCCSVCDTRHSYDDDPDFCMGCGAKVVKA